MSQFLPMLLADLATHDSDQPQAVTTVLFVCNVIIAVVFCYVSISMMVTYFRNYTSIASKTFWVFILLMFFCGISRGLIAVNYVYPVRHLLVVADTIIAAASLVGAILLPELIHYMSALPKVPHLHAINNRLAESVGRLSHLDAENEVLKESNRELLERVVTLETQLRNHDS